MLLKAFERFWNFTSLQTNHSTFLKEILFTPNTPKISLKIQKHLLNIRIECYFVQPLVSWFSVSTVFQETENTHLGELIIVLFSSILSITTKILTHLTVSPPSASISSSPWPFPISGQSVYPLETLLWYSNHEQTYNQLVLYIFTCFGNHLSCCLFQVQHLSHNPDSRLKYNIHRIILFFWNVKNYFQWL